MGTQKEVRKEGGGGSPRAFLLDCRGSSTVPLLLGRARTFRGFPDDHPNSLTTLGCGERRARGKDSWGKGGSGKLSKAVLGTGPKGRGTRRASKRGVVAEQPSSGTGWVGRSVSGGAGRASKSGPADRKAGREKQREPEIGGGEAHSPRYLAQGRALSQILGRGLVWGGHIP